LIKLYKSQKKPMSGKQNCRKQKLQKSDITDAKPPLSKAKKHPDFQEQVDQGNFTLSPSENRK